MEPVKRAREDDEADASAPSRQRLDEVEGVSEPCTSRWRLCLHCSASLDQLSNAQSTSPMKEFFGRFPPARYGPASIAATLQPAMQTPWCSNGFPGYKGVETVFTRVQ